mgnify:CR=1 FL=1
MAPLSSGRKHHPGAAWLCYDALFEMKGSHLFHLEYSVNENMPDDDPAYQSEPDKILRYDIAGGDSFPETMISNTYAATEMTLRRLPAEVTQPFTSSMITAMAGK